MGPRDALRIGLLAGDPRTAGATESSRPELDSLWMGGHVAARNPTPEALVALAALAATTRRVQVGTSVLLLPLYPPAIVAKQVADIDRIADGRVVLGIGVGGEQEGDFRAVQVPVAERGSRADEAIPLLRRFWTGDPVSHTGRHFSVDDVRIHPSPARSGGPPIVVAGRKPPAMRRAATLGDGWFPYLYSPRRYAESVRVIRRVADDAGRDLSSFGWYAWIFVNVGADGDAARDDTARFLGATYAQDVRAMVDRVAAAGTAAEVVARVREFHAAGARHFVFCPATTVDRGAVVERLFGEVVPALRAHHETGGNA